MMAPDYKNLSIAQDENGDINAVVARLSRTDWCNDLISSPQWTPTRTISRIPKPSNEDSLFAETFSTARTIQTYLALKGTEEVKDTRSGFFIREVRILVELGDGLNGFPETAHGGLLATLLDEAIGVLIYVNIGEQKSRKWTGKEGIGTPTTDYLTAYLNVSYRKRVPTPGMVLCTARFIRHERNKFYFRSTLEDGRGMVYTSAEALFIAAQSKL